MVHQLAEADGESTNLGRHQHVGTRGCLGTTLQGAVMQRTHLISVVGEIGVRTGIVERELATNEQARFVVRSGERSAESSAGLAIGHEGVGEEDTGLSGESVGNLTSLAHKAVLHLHRIGDAAAV